MESGATITGSSGAGAARIRVFGDRGRGFLVFFFEGGFGVGLWQTLRGVASLLFLRRGGILRR